MWCTMRPARALLTFFGALLLFYAPSVLAEDWPAVRETGLEIAPGSPLDLSTVLPNGDIGAERHLMISQGRFAFSSDPQTPVPLLCASLAWSPASGGFPDHDQADRYATQLARHGYNIARFHFVEAALMFERSADFDYDPETLDRFHYLLAALKREGISWIMDGLTSARGGLGEYDDRWDGVGRLKEDALLSPEGLRHWQRLQDDILGTPNPYTGLAPIADPALALIVLVNEGGLEFDGIVGEGQGEPSYSEAVRQGFNAFLLNQYGSSAALSAAWGGLGWGESLEAGTIRLPTNRWRPDPRFADLGAYFVAVERAGTAAMSASLRAMGYKGAISNFNNWPTFQAGLSRAPLEAITMNTYFDWVSGYAPGTTIEQESSIGRELDYLRMAGAARYLGRPFIVTEYDHLFWNRFRYEVGLAAPAYAALQGWDGLCRHGHGPIVLRYGEEVAHKRQMLPYAIALDPVARAGETLSALLFRRGDVAPASAEIALPLDAAALGPDINAREAEPVTALSIFGAIGIGEDAGPGGVTLPQARVEMGFSDLLDPLMRAGLVSDTQRSLAAEGIYRSGTGEITIVPARELMLVETSQTVGATFTGFSDPLELGPLRLSDPTGPALIALSALDSAPLEHSKRILVIFATDAHNTGMGFADAGQRTIDDFGTLPVRIRPAGISLDLAGTGPWTIAPVGLDGVVHPVLGRGEGRLEWRLDNVPPSGPTTYFVIERG